ncbi:MAG: DUF4856 domain-containing protein [Flavobacteriaceae bacterium]
MKKYFLTLSVTALLFSSCSSDDSVNNDPINDPVVETPQTYSFERDGSSTVSYSGQTTRILMGIELNAALTDNNKTEAALLSMYAHQEGNPDFSDPALNSSDKSLRSKTAASTDYFSANTTDAAAIKNQLDAWISAQATEVFSNWDEFASAGVAGQIQQAGGGAVRYVSAKGLEYNQAVIKSLIGGIMADQMLNNYLSPAVLDAGDNIENNNNDITEEGKNYTTMEHKWDEAFGYLYGTDNALNPELGQDAFLNKYLANLEGDADFAGIADKIYDAFKLGRAAIVAKDYDLRDEQAEIIQEEVSKIIGVRAVYYLQKGKGLLGSDQADAFHQLSEGFGFIYSLQFTRQPGTNNPYFSKTEVDTMLNTMMEGNGFWDITEETIDTFSGQIAARFGNFTVEQAAP